METKQEKLEDQRDRIIRQANEEAMQYCGKPKNMLTRP